MSKNKKKKSRQSSAKLSPEGYIRKKARSLPIHECLINTEWDESGMAQIIIARKHVNENVTLGLFLVDLYCLGVKDTFYQFNISTIEYEELKSRYLEGLETEECDYTLAHNIIYGAVAFAEDFGFQPHKDFNRTTQYILEEDNLDVELVDIEFGLNGKPCAVSSPHTDISPVVSQLEKTAGPGNYDVIYLDEYGNTIEHHYENTFDDEVEETDEDEEESDGTDYADKETEEALEEIRVMVNWTDKEWQDFFNGKTQISKQTFSLVIDSLYYSMFEEDEIDKAADEIADMLAFHITYESIDTLEPYAEYYAERAFNESIKLIDEVAERGNYSRAIQMSRNLIEKYPKNPVLYLNLIVFYDLKNKSRKSDDILIYARQKFPEDFFIKIHYGMYLLDRDKIAEFEQIFENKWKLADQLPFRDTFHISEVMSFHSLMIHYLLKTGETIKADLLFKEIKDFGDDQLHIVEDLNDLIMTFKTEKLKEFQGKKPEKIGKIQTSLKVVE